MESTGAVDFRGKVITKIKVGEETNEKDSFDRIMERKEDEDMESKTPGARINDAVLQTFTRRSAFSYKKPSKLTLYYMEDDGSGTEVEKNAEINFYAFVVASENLINSCNPVTKSNKVGTNFKTHKNF